MESRGEWWVASTDGSTSPPSTTHLECPACASVQVLWPKNFLFNIYKLESGEILANWGTLRDKSVLVKFCSDEQKV